MNAPIASCDFETRSACNLRKSGTWVYSQHPSTEVLCFVFRLPHWEKGVTALWHPAFPGIGLAEHFEEEALGELFDWLHSGGLVEAHNATFEIFIWMNQMVAQHGWPTISLKQWRCSAAKAAVHALPRGLADVASALNLRLRKDIEGSKVMMKLTKPRKSRKAERAQWAKDGVKPPAILYHESIELLNRLIVYCRQDVLTEEAVSKSLADLSPEETDIFLMDLAINLRGFQLDRPAVKMALQLIHREGILLNQELQQLTNGQVKKATQRAKMMAWFQQEGLELPDTQKGTIDGLLVEAESGRSNLPVTTHRPLEIVRALGRSSTAKYQSMRDWSGRDGRVRGGLLYHGASTGRWSGKGVQPHNFPKGTLKDVNMNALWTTLKGGKREDIASRYRSVMEAMACALRGAIIAKPGHELFVADYAAIEARVLLWLAEDEDALTVFEDGGDIYLEMAEEIYGYPCSKEDNPAERSLGKVVILACGFQMGWTKFQATAAVFGIALDDDMARQTVAAYRGKFPKVVAMWNGQEKAAIQAIQTKRPVTCGRVVWLQSRKDFLSCKLPSGRTLMYPYPEVKDKTTPWGEIRPSLSFMGVNPVTRKWTRQTTYGGMLVENCLAEGTPVLTARGWIPIESVQLEDRIWDGEEWVLHEGTQSNGVRETVIVDGLCMTPNHRVLTTEGWRDGGCTKGLDWAPARRPHSYWLRRVVQRTLAMAYDVCYGARTDTAGARYSDNGWGMFALSCGTGSSTEAFATDVEQHADAMQQPPDQILLPLWRARNYYLRAVGRVRQFLGGHASGVSTGAVPRQNQQRRELRALELSMGNVHGTSCEYQQAQTEAGLSQDCPRTGSWIASRIQQVLSGPAVHVYDIENCGPRNRFVVAGGRIVHNCTQAVARDLMAAAMLRCEASGKYPVVLSVHDEILAESPSGTGNVPEFISLLTERPEWAWDCPIAAEGFVTNRYRKA